ncbi:MAG TPA: hypothetical protein ENN98_06240 [Desulfurivibrio alkaliphilus]|uniref:Uncharacterized protein n=1 Tax=Desulfurivibrio alkaliphilus TaxID=427923 RepID=A0A7C2XAJ2_9BACT|nr:hypothetical protein [Desulfurivibrio alkaliphilus]
MKLENAHLMLVLAPDPERAAEVVLRFFARTRLVRYDRVEVDREGSCSADHPEFKARLEEGVATNRRVLGEIMAELKVAGVRSLDDLAQLPQSYQSKLAHTAAHLLDGFFGIDSAFFNLVEDSHWLSEPLAREIAQDPEDYHLLQVRAEIAFAQQRQLVSTMRKFES